MNTLLHAALVGSVVGTVGSGLGAVISFFIKGSGKKLPSILMSFSGGIMTAVVVLDLIPEAYRMGGVNTTVIGMLLGALFVVVLSYILPHADTAGEDRPMMRVGILIGAGIAIHNFPEGLAIGSGLNAGDAFGMGLAALIMLHDVPEGMAMSIPMRLGGASRPACLFWAVVAGLPTAIGSVLGHLIGNISSSFIGACMAFAGGAMLYITLKELIPESMQLYRGPGMRFAIMAGLAVGALMVFFI